MRKLIIILILAFFMKAAWGEEQQATPQMYILQNSASDQSNIMKLVPVEYAQKLPEPVVITNPDGWKYFVAGATVAAIVGGFWYYKKYHH